MSLNISRKKYSHTQLSLNFHCLVLTFRSLPRIMEGIDCQTTILDQPQTEDVVTQCPLCFPPVLDVSHELVGWQQVTGPIEDSTIGHRHRLLAAGGIRTEELPRINGGGAERTITAIFHSVLKLSLNVLLQIFSFWHLCEIQWRSDRFKQNQW